jgi:hypothetical protein
MDVRSPSTFLIRLREALGSYQQKGPEEKQIGGHCCMAAYAVSTRILGAGDHIAIFSETLSEPDPVERRRKEDRAIFDFHANALSAVDSFYFCAYFFGAALDQSRFSLSGVTHRAD